MQDGVRGAPSPSPCPDHKHGAAGVETPLSQPSPPQPPTALRGDLLLPRGAWGEAGRGEPVGLSFCPLQKEQDAGFGGREAAPGARPVPAWELRGAPRVGRPRRAPGAGAVGAGRGAESKEMGAGVRERRLLAASVRRGVRGHLCGGCLGLGQRPEGIAPSQEMLPYRGVGMQLGAEEQSGHLPSR